MEFKAKLIGRSGDREVPSAGQKEEGQGDLRGTLSEQGIKCNTRNQLFSHQETDCTLRNLLLLHILAQNVYTSHSDDLPPHYQLQRTPASTMLGISAIVHLLKLCYNYVSANSGRTRRCPCLKAASNF